MGRRSPVLALLALLTLAACAAPVEDDASDDASALGEVPNAGWSRAADARAELPRTILPWFHREGRFGELEGAAGVPIRHASFVVPREKAAIVFFQGRGESYLKYAEVTWDLTRHGYSVYLFDHRGQGSSGRMLPDRQKGYVDAFANYVSDAKRVVAEVVLARRHARVVGVGHSMGGAILTSYAMSHPDDFAGIVLSAPMHKINFPAWAGGEWTALKLAEQLTPDAYAPSQGPFDPNRANLCTTSDARWKAFNQLYIDYPETALGGTTNKWLVESILATRDLRERAGRLAAPTLLLQPTADEVVDGEAQDKVCKAAKRCRTLRFEGAKHELFIEDDAHRTRALEETLRFVDGLGAR